MKKSLIVRWSIILIIVLAWTWSIFPIKDKDYLVEFKRMASGPLATLQSKARNWQEAGNPEELKSSLDEISDQKSPEYNELKAKYQKILASPAYEAKMSLDDYQELWRRVEEFQQADTRLSGYKAMEMAAQGNADSYRISLGNYIKIPFQKKSSNKTVLRYVRLKSAGKLRLGLDLRGGTEFVVGFDTAKVPKDQEVTQIRDRILEILRNRVDVMGVTEPELKTISPNSISIRMPSVDEADKTDIRNTIRQNARLQFHVVASNNQELVQQYQENRQSFVTPANLLRSEIEEERNGEISSEVIFIEKKAEAIRGEDIDRAAPNVNEFGNWSISLRFKARGSSAFADVTGKNVGRRLAIVLDDKIYSAPNIREAITGGQAEISGSFTYEEANRLAGVISSGNLPVSIQIDSEFGTDPTLGVDSIRTGTFAGLLGLFLVIVFMLWYYQFAGIVAILALTVNTLLIFGSMALTKATITMPGLAGMVLSIGMAVDANILIFERIREELAKGKSISNAVAAGYDRVFSCILDANLTTLVTCFFLYRFGSGPIKGFAVTLGFGIVSSLFTALYMTHAIFDLMLYKEKLTELRMRSFKFLNNINIDFLRWMPRALRFSAGLIAICLLAMVIRRDSIPGIDFSGGTEFSYACEGDIPDVEKVRAYLADKGYDKIRVGYKRSDGGERQLEIILPEFSEEATLFSKELDLTFPACKLVLKQTNMVGGNVGAKFRKDAFWACLLSFLAIVAYLSFRFEFRYGVASVIALVHDVITSAGLFFIINQGQLSLPVIAALMAIIGYSINDTIVIFDRIRENQGLMKGRAYLEIVNISINQTLSRTLLTTLTTLLVIFSLLIFGGGVIFDFAIVMFYGMFSGTYSSIFIATALIRTWHKKSMREARQKGAAGLAAKLN